MIKKVITGKEIAVGVINEIGALSTITSLLVNHGINIGAVAGYSTIVGEQAELMFITDNNLKAVEALVEHGYKFIRENDIIIIEIENNPGALKNISERLAQNAINITYIYGTTCIAGCPMKMILSTSDNARAINLLSKP